MITILFIVGIVSCTIFTFVFWPCCDAAGCADDIDEKLNGQRRS